MVEGLWFRVQGSWFTIQVLGLMVQDSCLEVGQRRLEGEHFQIRKVLQGSGFRV
jgi:hypothetical protein